MSEPYFRDRASAGRQLAEEVVKRGFEQPVVFALPRGGVPVAAPIAAALGAPLDLLMVRKLGVPWQPELAAGSIVDGEKPDVILNDSIVHAAGLSDADMQRLGVAELREIERRRALYLPNRAPISARERTAILVDDGIATGASMRAAITAVRRRRPLRIVVAVPVAARETVKELEALVEEVICLAAPTRLAAVGYYYEDFHQLDDREVILLLADTVGRTSAARPGGADRLP
jgi:putative phosphoribosyl transferase